MPDKSINIHLKTFLLNNDSINVSYSIHTVDIYILEYSFIF